MPFRFWIILALIIRPVLAVGAALPTSPLPSLGRPVQGSPLPPVRATIQIFRSATGSAGSRVVSVNTCVESAPIPDDRMLDQASVPRLAKGRQIACPCLIPSHPIVSLSAESRSHSPPNAPIARGTADRLSRTCVRLI